MIYKQMKKLLFILAVFHLFFSCKKDESNSIPETSKESTINSVENVKIDVPVNLSIDEIPAEIKFEGKIKNAVKWSDKLGENVVITTETGIYESTKFEHEHNGGDAEIFAYHFIKTDGSFQHTWKVYDFISDCPVDIVAEFVGETFQITDLDDNGVAEIWLMYKTVCHGDVSPSDLKIIMYEGNQKYAMRGETKVSAGIDDNGNPMYYGGEYTVDSAFTNGSPAFLEFAKKMWDENLIETWN